MASRYEMNQVIKMEALEENETGQVECDGIKVEKKEEDDMEYEVKIVPECPCADPLQIETKKEWVRSIGLVEIKQETDEKGEISKIECEVTVIIKNEMVDEEESVTQKSLDETEKSNRGISTQGNSNWNFKCDECGRFFAKSYSLTVHKFVHSGEKPYKCLQCERSFSQSCNLSRHMRTHSAEKPYRCANCPRWFTLKDSLLRHVRAFHTG